MHYAYNTVCFVMHVDYCKTLDAGAVKKKSLSTSAQDVVEKRAGMLPENFVKMRLF